MQLQSLNCNSCGAQLHVAETANFVTCAHCDAQLAIHRNESSVYTEQIAELKAQTSEMAEHLAKLAYEKQLERIDEDWDEEERRYISYDSHGRVVGPSMLTFAGIVLVVSGAAFLLLPYFSWPGRLLGLPIIALGAWLFIVGIDRKSGYDKAYDAYLRRRANVKLSNFLPWSRRNQG